MNKKQTARLVVGLSLVITIMLVWVTTAQESVPVPTAPTAPIEEQQSKERKEELKKAFARLKPEELTGEQQTDEQKKMFAFLTSEEIDVIYLVLLRDESLRQSDPEKLVAVISVTERRKIVEAVPELVNLLTFKREFEWEKRERENPPAPGEPLIVGGFQQITPRVRYPAIGALAQIGKPALPALLEVIKNQDSESLESQNALEALQAVFYPDLQQTVDFLRQQANESAAPSNLKLYAAAEKITKRIKR